MAKKRNSKANPRQRAVLTILAVILVAVVCLYTVINGLGAQHKGSAKNIELGLDLAGGVSITYEINDKNPSDTDIQDTIYKLQKRVEGYSTEAEVYKEGSKRITVEIPGVTDANTILEELGKPGDLEFQTEDGTVVLTGANIKKAEAGTTEENGMKNYVVQLSMDKEGAKAFATATAANIGKRILIVYDGETVSAPVVNSAITNGSCVVENMESYDTAAELASTIRIGALPLTLTEMRSNVVGAKLGQDAIATSLRAGAIGLALVFIFMTIIYLFPGFVAGIALIVYVILDLLAINGFDATLTLPGIAGILLAIGMAVDANVIIFTRIREEIATGKSVLNSIKGGYDKALSAILDGNITTLIAAAVLWMKGSGSVRGFAQTLAIGILLSMFTALFVTKHLLLSFYELGVKDQKFYGCAKAPKIRDYVKLSKICMIISLVVIILGFVFMPINKKNIGNILNYDLEFSGGTSVTMTVDDGVTDEIDKAICDTVKATVDVKTVQSQKVLGSNQLVVKTNELSVADRQKLETALKDSFKVSDYRTEEIAASVSNEMKSDAITAVIIAAICMLIYIAFRFKDVKFAGSAVIALLHDVFVVLTVYSVCRLSVGNTFIACMLTILGYSINATIIIFDRIRENMKNNQLMKQGLDVVVNESISQTFTRTINTSITSFITIFVLYILGVPSIKEFTLTLMCGIVCGAYSSVCITGPIWFFMKNAAKKKESAKVASKKKK
ncbi:MAG: protein translocase subunit SecD [Eubacteriales bacterium]|nr:protein translocase subunit SecD [Eubacteriales bacterium]